MQLYEQGLWSLDDPVSKFIPSFGKVPGVIQPKVGDNDGKHDLVPLSRPITMRDVFTHTSGVSYSIMTNLSNGAINLAQKLYEQSGVMQAGTLEETKTLWQHFLWCINQGHRGIVSCFGSSV